MSKYEQHVIGFLIFLACILTTVTTDCTNKSLSGRNTHQISLEKECSVFAYENETLSTKSISRVLLRTTPDDEVSNPIFADVIVEEYKIDEGNYIVVDTWTINSNETFKRSHFSQNVNIRITFKTKGIWSTGNISLRYEEIKFEKFESNTSQVERNEITPWVKFDEERHYRPNSNYVFHIDKNESLSSSSVLITLNQLDIDKELGEYLLIGAGLEPFEGPPPLCITEAVGKKKYLVDDEAAYIVFVTNATRKDHTGFNISWDYKGTAIKEPDTDDKQDIKESASICIYNISAAMEELTKSRDSFKDFREKFAEVATNYTNATNAGNDNGNSFVLGVRIKASSVSIYQVSGKFKDNKSREALYAMVRITDDTVKGKAVFQRHQLEEIVSIYSEKASAGEISDIFMFRKCGSRYVPESWFYFGLILVIPVVCFALLLWVWKQNPIAEHYEKKRKLKRASQHENSKYYADNCDFGVQSPDGNPYSTLPKVQVTNEQGRRTTLNFSDTLLCGDDNASDDELFNKLYTSKRRSDVLELQRMKMANRFILDNEGEDNPVFELNEDNNSAMELKHEDRAEHTYESVKSSASLGENTRL